jgi:glycosyltransferase involved in cell wall biosynthesis
VIPYGVPRLDEPGPIGVFLETGLAGRPYVLAMGRQDVRKNLRRLVDAFGLVAVDDTDERPGLCLVIAGPAGADTPAIEAAIGRLPIEIRGRVLRPGYVTSGQRAGLILRARALAYPSLYEGFGFPPLEAMMAGTPVLVGRGGAVGEVAGPAAEQVDATDIQDLAAGLRRVVFDEARRSELIEAGRRHAATFTWERTARDLSAMYRGVAGASPGPRRGRTPRRTAGRPG